MISLIVPVIVGIVGILIGYFNYCHAKKATQIAEKDFENNNAIKIRVVDFVYAMSVNIRGYSFGPSIQVYNGGRIIYSPSIELVFMLKGSEGTCTYKFGVVDKFSNFDFKKESLHEIPRGMLLNLSVDLSSLVILPESILRRILDGDFAVKIKIFSQMVEIYSILVYDNDEILHISNFNE